jgi:hypothetical protein
MRVLGVLRVCQTRGAVKEISAADALLAALPGAATYATIVAAVPVAEEVKDPRILERDFTKGGSNFICGLPFSLHPVHPCCDAHGRGLKRVD